MGFLGTIPATKLAAFYDTGQQKLILYAQGVVKGATYGFNFQRDTFMGGLKFTLQAWTGPLTGKEQPYEHSQGFIISLPQPHFNSKSVLIVTANHPQGETVPIHYSGLIHTDTELAAANKAGSAPASAPVTTATPDSTQLNVLFKMPFNISENAEVPKMGAVDVQYDNTILQLVTAGISNTDIVWTFNSLQTGDTQILVTIYGGIAQFVIRKTYNVRIFVL
ncbi:MAG: hypothetical protein JWQ84_554 [Mucilaginibacter sp.]|nr:hypothetical protein [Mucilaginibacter sp.]MDB5139606.1 hypothetical protein [Mucilaginibacter sp.]